jgi:putative cell wall-binding protein
MRFRRFAMLTASTTIVAAVGIAAIPTAALAEDSFPPIVAPTMGSYDLDSYADEATLLDPQLEEALWRDLGISGAEYLAEGAAAADASYVIESLGDDGFAVLGSQITGTELTVYVDSEAAAQAVAEAGAIAEFGTPDVRTFDDSDAEPYADLYDGQGYYFKAGLSKYTCSLGFTGKATANGANQFVTAGHCTPPEPLIGQYSALNPVRAGQAYYQNPAAEAGPIGLPIAGTFAFGGGSDVGLVGITAAGVSPKPAVLTYGFSDGAPLASAPVQLRDARAAVVGANLCKSGVRTGWTCGKILAVDQSVDLGKSPDKRIVNSIIATTCSGQGDSGGAAVNGTVAIGITSGGRTIPCTQEGYWSSYFPMVSVNGGNSVNSTQGSRWEPSVFVPAPTVSSPTNSAKVLAGSTMSGTLPGFVSSNKVRVSIDSASPRVAAVGADGRWSVDLAGVGPGNHSYSAVGAWNNYSVSTPVTGSFTVVAKPAVERISGADRYAVAIQVSNKAFPGAAPTVPIAYIVTGEGYADALSAAPAAVKTNGPLLLTQSSWLPDSVVTELKRLKPGKIVVVGGPNSVSAGVYNQLTALAPQIQRIGGADRYETSRAVVANAFSSSKTAYVATGQNFPDALSASAAAGAILAPVLLVNGSDSTIDSSTRSLLSALGTQKIKIAGGPNSVSNAVESALKTISPTVRLSGSDRYDTSIAINRDGFQSSGAPAASAIYLSTGANFPDALAGAALAGKVKAPVYMVQPSCLPAGVASDIAAFQLPSAKKVWLLGGNNALNPSIEQLTVCQ